MKKILILIAFGIVMACLGYGMAYFYDFIFPDSQFTSKEFLIFNSVYFFCMGIMMLYVKFKINSKDYGELDLKNLMQYNDKNLNVNSWNED